MSTEINNQGTLDAALEIAARRASVQREVKELLIANKDREAVKLMRRYLGIDEDKPSRADRRYPRSLALVKGK